MNTSAGPTFLGPAEVRSLARRLGLRPTKRLGQNFVHDANTVRRIVAAADLGAGEQVLEVGPGLGSLTLGLLAAGHRVLAVEVDATLADALPGTIAAHAPDQAAALRVLHADALRVSADRLLDATGGEPITALVANLPYNVAVPVLLHVLAEVDSIRRGIVMVQAEVADRLAATAGTSSYGVPSVKLAWYADVRRAGSVGRTVFWPVPNVDSGLVVFDRHPAPADVPRDQLFRLVDAGFAQRRKTLRAALSGWAGSAAAAERILRSAGVDPTTRAEQLTVSDFARICSRITGGSDTHP